MIISRTPYRISFFGGGSDYPVWYEKYGGEVLSSTIDKYVYISLRDLPRFFKKNYRLSYSRIEETNNINSIKHKVVKKAMLYYKRKKNFELHYNGELPSRSGMGSSSSFVVGIKNILNNLDNNEISKNLLAKKSIFFEQKILKECVGSQDQVAVSYGGFNYIKFFKNQNFSVQRVKNIKFIEELNKRLIILYTGQQRTANDIAKNFVFKLTKSKKHEINTILQIVQESKRIIENNRLNDFGKLLNESWNVKKKLDRAISNSDLDDIYQNGIKNGALGGKILGAGGGGFFLFFVPVEKKKHFIKKMSKLISISFKFENFGSKIIYKS